MEERIEKKEDRGEKEASVLGFSLPKRPCGSGTTGKEDEENALAGAGQLAKEACCCCCFFFLKRNASLGEERRVVERRNEREEREERSTGMTFEKLFLMHSCRPRGPHWKLIAPSNRNYRERGKPRSRRAKIAAFVRPVRSILPLSMAFCNCWCTRRIGNLPTRNKC